MFSNLYNKCIDYFTYKPKYPLFPDTETLKYYISVVGIIPPYFIFNNLLSSNEDYFPLLYSFSTIGNLEYNTSNLSVKIQIRTTNEMGIFRNIFNFKLKLIILV